MDALKSIQLTLQEAFYHECSASRMLQMINKQLTELKKFFLPSLRQQSRCLRNSGGMNECINGTQSFSMLALKIHTHIHYESVSLI